MRALKIQKAVDELKAQDNTVDVPKLFRMLLAFLAERSCNDDLDDAIAHINEHQESVWTEREERNDRNRSMLRHG